jgi:hypothetical protein
MSDVTTPAAHLPFVRFLPPTQNATHEFDDDIIPVNQAIILPLPTLNYLRATENCTHASKMF